MKHFRDQLSLEEIASGFEIVLDNVQDLFDAGRLLLDDERYSTARGLAIMALEESGKLRVLRTMVQRGGLRGVRWRELWQPFRSHLYKSSSGMVDQYGDDFRGDPDVILTLALLHHNSAHVIESERQASFYVDFSGDRRMWTSPRHVTKAQAVEVLSQVSLVLQRAQNQMRAGLMSLQALVIMRDVYEPAIRDVLKSDAHQITLGELAQKLIPYHREWFDRLRSEEVLPPNCDLNLLI